MPTEAVTTVNIDPELLAAVAALPASRTVSHCGAEFAVSPFDLYATCPACKARLKVRGFTAGPELVDVFDAVFAWMEKSLPSFKAATLRRQELVAELPDDMTDPVGCFLPAPWVPASAEFVPFAYLRRAAEMAYQTSMTSRFAARYHRTTAVALTAFTVEALLNHIGEARLLYWDIVERGLSWQQKLDLIARHYGFRPDRGRRPYQTLKDLFAFRDKLVHGKTWRGEATKNSGGFNASVLPEEPELFRRFWSDREVKAVLEDVSAVIEDLLSRAGMPDDGWAVHRIQAVRRVPEEPPIG